MKNRQYLVGAWLAFAVVLSSCSHRNDIKAEVTPNPETTKILADLKKDSQAPKLAHYIVRKGDCLWRISAKKSVLGDAFRWPLLYKQNRDEIANPDLIEPRQDLSYERHYDTADIAQAVKQAEGWPAYVSAAKRNEPLPVKD